MKLLAIIFSIVCISQFSANTQELADKRKITVTVPNVTSDKGAVHYALYTKKTFMQVPIQSKIAAIKNKKSVVVFENVPEGEYAIICFHDANGNKEMDFSERGMPIEDYGMSNNSTSFGPPQFLDAKFVVADKNVTLEIKF
ncbi:hypothetical protein GCM10011416_22010 [Polaribacter pacificus]|uniref:DUF2141 domain-containing protein n=1 Tax=Polaribacter pacificus TaxID=1775173 RepID=A0A917MF50_9FLAO|nr:DUF2141 domain-containing protein [Polaribacter pacificus]GGH02756.1 hypothetical protein GCM10011416_22010 [Polaribacter pacificus]